MQGMGGIKKLAMASAIAGAMALAGCGGGGGGSSAPSTTLSGTAAGGAPVIGTVLVTDSLGNHTSGNIDTTGHYSVDVSGMTGPFVLKASGTVGGTNVTYYSAATQADVGGTVDVTPFTDLIVSNIAATMASNYFVDGVTGASINGLSITPDKLAAAESALHAKLLPALHAMNISDTLDLLRASFAADHSGLDLALDQIKVETDLATNIATLKYAATTIGQDNVTVADNVHLTYDNAVVTTTPGMATAGTDLQAVVTQLNGFAALFATGLPSINTITNAGVFDSGAGFMMGGQTFAEFASDMSTNPKVIGMKFSNVAISLDASGTTGTLTADISSNNATFADTIQLVMAKGANGAWLIEGDRRIADIKVTAQAQLNLWTNINNLGIKTSGQSTESGIWVNIDPHFYNANNVNAMAVSAVVTGPGLPANGVTMVQDTQNTWFDVQGMGSNNIIPECGMPVDVPNGPITPVTQCVTIAQAVDNSVYTVVLEDANGNPLNGASYTLTLPKQPYATSALTNAMFPSITSVQIGGADITPDMMMNGQSVTVNWTMPAGLMSKNVDIWGNTASGSAYNNLNKDLQGTATQAIFGLGNPNPGANGTVTSAGVWLSGVDTYGRILAVSKSVCTGC